MNVEIPFLQEINPAVIKQVNDFSLEQWMLYIAEWPLSLAVLISLALNKDAERNFWLGVFARAQFEKQHQLEVQILQFIEDYARAGLLDAITIKLIAERGIADMSDFSTENEV